MHNDYSIEELYERLNRLENLVKDLLDLLGGEETLSTALFLTEIGILVPVKIVSYTRKLKTIYKDLMSLGFRDDITRMILSILAAKNEMSVTELERELRRIRGKASRRIIYERLRKLENAGIIVSRKEGNKRLIRIAEKYSLEY